MYITAQAWIDGGGRKEGITHSQVGIIMSALVGRAPSHVLVGRGLEALVQGDRQRHQVIYATCAPVLIYFHTGLKFALSVALTAHNYYDLATRHY